MTKLEFLNHQLGDAAYGLAKAVVAYSTLSVEEKACVGITSEQIEKLLHQVDAMVLEVMTVQQYEEARR